MKFVIKGATVLLLAIVATATINAQNSRVARVEDVLNSLQVDFLSREWRGTELFCVFGDHDVARNADFLQHFISELSISYGSDFTLTRAQSHHACPSNTTFFVQFSGEMENSAIASVLFDLSGSEPPISEMSLEGARGFAIELPGRSRREYIFVNTQTPPISSNPNPVRSILVEEVTHALTTLGDFETQEMISILGKNLNVQFYDDWFEINPTGLCLADLLLLDMQIGADLGSSSHHYSATEWMETNAIAIPSRLSQLDQELNEFRDERC